MAAAFSSFDFFRPRCATCTMQACKRFGQSLERQSLVCDKTGCPVLNSPSVFKSWWMRTILALVLIATGVGVVRQIGAARLAARRPRLISLSSQPNSWRGEPWEAFIKATGEGTLTYQWYSGFPGDVSAPVESGTESTLRIQNLQNKARYWARISSEYGSVDSEGLAVEPHTMDTNDHRGELDELISFSRTMLEQLDNLREIENLFTALVPLDASERRRFEDLRVRSDKKSQQAAGMLVEKLRRLRTNANTETINKLLNDGRPAALPSDSLEGERQRKAYSIIETLWRQVRDGNDISDKTAIELSIPKLPL